MTAGLSRRLTEHLAGTRFCDLPPEAVAAAKNSLMDAVGVMLAASRMGEGVEAFVAIAKSAQHGPSSVLGHDFRAPPMMAAFANGAMAHALDYEDSHDAAPLHPNAALVPALLALGQAHAVDGRTLLTALAAGCDLTCRVGISLTADMAEGGWYPPPILGALGAAAACACLLGLDAEGIASALSLVLCQTSCSGEIKVSPQSQLRAVRDAFPAQAAVGAALLAAGGVKGFDHPLEGGAGFFALFARGHYDEDRLLNRLGRHWMGTELSFKPWPSCRGTHAAIEAVLVLREKVNPFEVKDIRLTISPVQAMLCLPRPQRINPKTAIDAKFSLPFTVAHALVHGSVTLDSFEPGPRTDPLVLDMAAHVSHEIDAAASMVSARVEMETHDGRRLTHQVECPLGHPGNPISDERLRAKFMDCASRAFIPVPPRKAQQAIEVISQLDWPGATLAKLFAVLEE